MPMKGIRSQTTIAFGQKVIFHLLSIESTAIATPKKKLQEKIYVSIMLYIIPDFRCFYLKMKKKIIYSIIDVVTAQSATTYGTHERMES